MSDSVSAVSAVFLLLINPPLCLGESRDQQPREELHEPRLAELPPDHLPELSPVERAGGLAETGSANCV